MDPVYSQRGYDKGWIVGKGAFGQAVVVRRNADQQRAVCKEIKLASLSEKERDAALREAMLLSRLDHPNIIHFHESWEEKKKLYIVMEYADGGDLSTKIKAHRTGLAGKPLLFKEDQIMAWFVQLCLALKHIHDRKILHRDLKAGNVFLTKDGTVKLGDLGLSTILTNTVAMAKTVCGTPYYFSPELCKNEYYNNKSDVWALGCILYEMCTLQHAFDASNIRGLMRKILKGQYAPPAPIYSPQLVSLIGWLLTLDSKKRPSVNQILAKDFVKQHIMTYHASLESNLRAVARTKNEKDQVMRQQLADLRAKRRKEREKQELERQKAIDDRVHKLRLQEEERKMKAAEERKKEEQERLKAELRQQEDVKIMNNLKRGDLKNFLKGPPPEEIQKMKQAPKTTTSPAFKGQQHNEEGRQEIEHFAPRTEAEELVDQEDCLESCLHTVKAAIDNPCNDVNIEFGDGPGANQQQQPATMQAPKQMTDAGVGSGVPDNKDNNGGMCRSLREFLAQQVGPDTLKLACELMESPEEDDVVMGEVDQLLGDDNKELTSLIAQLVIQELKEVKGKAAMLD
eukprot:TRINITY_DN61693_c0_g1_i1.p1 TRINITY_DN61693_c0_g1~~TRINITY_DN61693_c0_g1_i1.p1  ORF type:complete len:569 (+),score=99.11 TRINITY_DN61693_c0_g1_i1:68-1774(+)